MSQRMTRLVLLIALVCAPLAAAAQDVPLHDGLVIATADLSGLGRDRLSSALVDDIDALAGTPLSSDRLHALAARIEAEHPDMVAAVRDVALADGRVRVVFLVAAIGDDAGLQANINARYLVDEVRIVGLDEARISQPLRDALQALVGTRFDNDEADRLADRLKVEWPDYDVGRRVSRSDESGHIHVDFVFTRAERGRWLHFAPSRSKLVYHANQGWSGVLDIQMGSDNARATVGLVGSDNDDLVEEYSGYSFRFENREAGTKRLGVSFDVSRYTQTWRNETQIAAASFPDAAGLYRTRVTASPAISFAIDRTFHVTGGIVATQLTPVADVPLTGQVPVGAAERVNAGMFVAAFQKRWRTDRRGSHRLEASYEWHGASASLSSDLDYTRQEGRAQYRFDRRSSTVIASLQLGRITGDAPLYERFTIGDSSTLRGWNKYEIVPLGASRLAYESVEYRFHDFAYFLDVGTIWSPGDDRRVRVSTGVGFHGDNSFVTVGVPINADEVSATFIAGVRF
jgi:hypothetical protein